MPINIIYSDQGCVVINKPSGMPSHPLFSGGHFNSSNYGKLNALDEVCKLFPEISTISIDRAEKGLVHRLDTGTSGLLMFARNVTSYKFLRNAFSKGTVKKTYVALIEGIISKPITIHYPIAHHQKNQSKMIAITEKNKYFRGKPRCAITSIFPIYISPINNNWTFVRIAIHGGCRHQIRTHLSSIGHPIVGDVLYGARHTLEIDKFYLHAESIHLPYNERKIINSLITWGKNENT